MRNLLRRRRGFTLLELLVVVVILGVLALVAVPIFRQFTDNANTTAAFSSAKNIASQANAASLEAGEQITTTALVKEAADGAGVEPYNAAQDQKRFYFVVNNTAVSTTEDNGCLSVHINGAYARVTISDEGQAQAEDGAKCTGAP